MVGLYLNLDFCDIKFGYFLLFYGVFEYDVKKCIWFKIFLLLICYRVLIVFIEVIERYYFYKVFIKM